MLLRMKSVCMHVLRDCSPRKRKRIRASADRVIDSMGALKKSALNRAQGFRNPKVENRYLETFTESLKERFKRERIKKAKKAKKADK